MNTFLLLFVFEISLAFVIGVFDAHLGNGEKLFVFSLIYTFGRTDIL